MESLPSARHHLPSSLRKNSVSVLTSFFPFTHQILPFTKVYLFTVLKVSQVCTPSPHSLYRSNPGLVISYPDPFSILSFSLPDSTLPPTNLFSTLLQGDFSETKISNEGGLQKAMKKAVANAIGIGI